ncbi:relaxase/mobilization nuclease domain-containing protein [Candidatus Microthrix parvicella]|uniref:Putative relaxase domain protein n=1 Tax=Candidatus Neomicrothrix parvicella RN1 TaxID=1229780 RepID=R4Z079_9ACTN|nr:relaxase/mobilization nuclease domain-containing protein [Candidatus Microthrix parvicella]CCM62037.1 putative relaxase domain protein [Candidatus Microthrix parvicella RN1]
MNITTVDALRNLGVRGDYLEFGSGAMKAGHKDAGTNRLGPGFYCDAPTIEAFIHLGNRLAEQNGRKVKAHSYLMSWPPDQLDVNDPADLQRAGDLAFLFAKKVRPNSPCLIVVHHDGAGGCVHAHIVTLNHDLETGKSPRDFRVHWQVKRANDELMREQGMDVVEPQHMTSKRSYFDEQRGDMAGFDQQLGDAIVGARADALADPSAVELVAFDAAFDIACAARGVEVVKKDFEVKSDRRRGKTKGDTAVGVTYRMFDEVTPNKKPRWRRRKASSLSPEFTTDGLADAFEKMAQQRAQPIEPPPTLDRASAGGGIDDMGAAAEADPEYDSVDEIALRLRRKLARRKTHTPARQRYLAQRQRPPQRSREYGD